MTNFNEDYTAQLRLEYEDLRKKVRSGMLPLVARLPAIEKAVTTYVGAHESEFERKRAKAMAEGRSVDTVPIPYRDERLLHQFADLVMHEELTWSHPDKMSIVEYPVMSDRQTKSYYGDTSHKSELQFGDLRFLGKRKTVVERRDGSYDVRFNRVLTIGNGEEDATNDRIDVISALEGAELTERQLEAITLVYFGNEGEGMTQAEAGAEMGVSRRAVGFFLDASFAKIKRYMLRSTTGEGV